MNVFSGSEPLPNGCDISLADVSTNESEVKRRSLILSSSSTSGASGQTQVMNMLKKPFGAANLMTNKLKSSSSKHDIIDQNHHESTTNRYGFKQDKTIFDLKQFKQKFPHYFFIFHEKLKYLFLKSVF